MLLGVSWMVVGRRGAAQGGTRVTGRVTLLEKDSRPSRDLGAAVVYFGQPAADRSFRIEDVPPGRYVLHAWHERSPQVTQDVLVTAEGASGIDLQLDARGFRWVPHKNKYGKDYPTNAGRERY